MFEKELRGTPGLRHHLVDVRNNVRNTLTELDSLPEAGDDVTLTIDAELQRYAEELMVGKRGAVVALEPATGEILAFVSAPSYDGNLLTGTSRGAAYDSLAKHPWKPLYNRAVRGAYRPGPFSNGARLDWHARRGHLRAHPHRVQPRCHRLPVPTPKTICAGPCAQLQSYFYDVMRRMVNQHPNLDKFDNARLAWLVDRADQRLWVGHGLGRARQERARFGARHHVLRQDLWTSALDLRTIYSISIGEGELLATRTWQFGRHHGEQRMVHGAAPHSRHWRQRQARVASSETRGRCRQGSF